MLLSVGPSEGKWHRDRKVLTSPRLPFHLEVLCFWDSLQLLGNCQASRHPDSIQAFFLWWDSLFLSSSTLPCAWRNSRGSRGAVCSAFFQISFPHQSDHQPGSPAQAGGAAWPQGAGRGEEGGECKTFWEAAVWPQAQPSFPGPGLPLWNALDLRFRLLTPSEVPYAGLGEWERA